MTFWEYADKSPLLGLVALVCICITISVLSTRLVSMFGGTMHSLLVMRHGWPPAQTLNVHTPLPSLPGVPRAQMH